MGRVWTRADWNDIIRRINDVAEACSFGDLLQEVPASHVWSVADITVVRDRLAEMCANSPGFSADLVKWKLEIIDELNEAINDCDCGCTQALVDDTRSLHGQASYVYHTYGNTQWLYNEWFGGDDHWHFQWTYKQDYDYTVAIGMGYGQQGMRNVGHTCKFRLEWWYWPWEGPMQFLSSEEELGLVETNCDGMVTAAPAGTYVKTFPQDYRVAMQPSGWPFQVWNTAGAACC